MNNSIKIKKGVFYFLNSSINDQKIIQKSIFDNDDNYSKELLPIEIIQKYKFIDLFAGIGGFRLGLQRNFSECSFRVNGINMQPKRTSLILEKNLLEILMN